MVRRAGVKWSLGVLQLSINYGTTTNRLAMTAEILNLSFIIVLPLMQLSNIIALYRVTNIVHGNKSFLYPV